MKLSGVEVAAIIGKNSCIYCNYAVHCVRKSVSLEHKIFNSAAYCKLLDHEKATFAVSFFCVSLELSDMSLVAVIFSDILPLADMRN